MSLTDEIAAHLAEHGPASASDIAQALDRDAGAVARMLGKLRAAGRVLIAAGRITADDVRLASTLIGSRT